MELAIVLMMLLIIVAFGAMKLNEPALAFPFKKKTTLYTAVEKNFLDLIDEAVGQRYRIICRVKLVDILMVRQNTDKKTSKNALSRAQGKQLDFVLCAKDDLRPLLAIDLVHKGSKDGYKSQRDWFTSGALDAARIPHLRIKVRSGYKAADIRECIDSKLAVMRASQVKVPLVQGTKVNEDGTSAPTRPTRPLSSSRPTSPDQTPRPSGPIAA